MTLLPCRISLIVCIGTALGGVSGASAAPGAVVGRFDFAYSITGDVEARPVQVFDDGVGKTYFQFKTGSSIPAIFTAEGSDMLLSTPEGPYHVVPSRARDFVLALGTVRARVTHAAVLSGAQPSGSAAVQSQSMSQAQEARHEPPRYDSLDRTQSSYATPLRGDVIEWVEPLPEEHAVSFDEGSTLLGRRAKVQLAAVAKGIGIHAKVQILVPDDKSLKQDLWDIRAKVLRASLVENGIPPTNIKVLRADETGGIPARESMGSSYRKRALLQSHIRWFPTATSRPSSGITNAAATASGPMQSPSLAPGRFIIQRSDVNAETVLRRWAHGAGYELRWEAPVAPALGDVTFGTSEFIDAVDQLMQRLQSMGHSLRVVIQSDRLLRVIKAD